MPDLDARDDAQQPGAPDEAALAIVARHALHDEELVAALAAGALDGEDAAEDRARARSFTERCPACRALDDDIAAIGGSLRAEASFTATAPRDFRLTVEDAHRLGGTVITRRVAGGLRAMLLGVARPIGASVAALSLVGVLVGSAVLGAGGLVGAPAQDTAGTMGGAAAPSAPAAEPTSYEVAINPGEAQASAKRGDAQVDTVGRESVTPSAGAWLLALSVLGILVGVGLFVVGSRGARGTPAGTRDH